VRRGVVPPWPPFAAACARTATRGGSPAPRRTHLVRDQVRRP
jgi:hypothetical protein